MRRTTQPIEPVRKQRQVPIPPERAFELFTAGMGRWWPLSTHSIAAADATGVRFEGRVGGQIVELTADGTEHLWAVVTTWDPPHRLVLSWHPTIEPEAASTVEVRFLPVEGGTRVELEHRDFEELGEVGPVARENYDPGWEPVLDRLLTRAEAST